MQDALWNLRHSASEHIPGKISLCIGLPVMIRNNDATELCITKGQEGHIVLKYRKVTRPGIEPRTFWTYTRCSNQLSYPALY